MTPHSYTAEDTRGRTWGTGVGKTGKQPIMISEGGEGGGWGEEADTTIPTTNIFLEPQHRGGWEVGVIGGWGNVE